MHRWINLRARSCAAALFISSLAIAACNDGTGPGGPLGRQLLESPGITAWIWLPSGQEILYSTALPYPNTGGPPNSLVAVAVSSRAKRTVVPAPSNGDQIDPYWFAAVGSHVYYLVSHPPSDTRSLYRAALDGSAAPQLIVEAAPFRVAVSPDERAVAWLERDYSGLVWTLVTMDVASGARRVYALEHPADRVLWSPTGRGVVADYENAWSGSGTPFQWVDLETGAVRTWLAPSDEITTGSTRNYRWEGDVPFLYTIAAAGAGLQWIARYSLATGAREILAPLQSSGLAIGWSPDFETVVVSTDECLRVSTGPFGGNCLAWSTTVDRIEWRSGTHARILYHEGPSIIGGYLSPSAEWLGYQYNRCGGGCMSSGDGLYVVAIR